MPRMERNIFKRRDGRFEARYPKGHDANGKTVYGSVYARNYADVKAKRDAKIQQLQQIQAAVQPPMLLPPSSQTVVDGMRQYLASIRNKVKPSTQGVYKRYLDSYIEPFFKDASCSQLAFMGVQSFVDEQFESGLSAVTIKAVYCLLKKGLKRLCPDESAFTVKLPKPLYREVEVLSIKEQKCLEAAAKASDDVNRIGIILCLYTGIRVGELCGLQWKDVDFERRTLHVRRTVQRIYCDDGGNKKTVITSTAPKSGASQRSIPLPGFLVSFLKEHRQHSTSIHVLSQKDGKPLEPRNMQHRFKRLLILADVREVNFHVTRHTFATRALESGFDIKSLSEILGHASVLVTFQKYAHTLDEHKRRNMESLIKVYE